MNISSLFKAFYPALMSALIISCGGSSGDSGGSGGTGSSTQSWPTCSYEDAIAKNCGCDIQPPVDLATVNSYVTLWPFGVHAQSGHTEGHRGLDYTTSNSTPVNVYAPGNGSIYSIENSQDSSGGLAAEYDLSDSHVRFTTINLDCGLQVRFIPLKLVDGLTAGSTVTKGQLIGTLPEMRAPYGPNVWSTHFETDAKTSSSDSALNAICPTGYYSATDITYLDAMLAASTYPEKSARSVSISCDSGGSITMNYSAENQLCNSRLSSTDRSTLAACIVSKASTIW